LAPLLITPPLITPPLITPTLITVYNLTFVLFAVLPAIALMHGPDNFNLSLLPLALELLKAPAKLPELTLAGVLYMTLVCIVNRPAVAVKALEHDAVEILMRILREATPTELIATAGHAQRPHGLAISVMKDLVETAQAVDVDMTAQLLSCGYIDVLISALNAATELGAEHVNAEVVTYGGLWLLKVLDGKMLHQIEDKLRASPAMLRYMVDSTFTRNLPLLVNIGHTLIACSCFQATSLVLPTSAKQVALSEQS
jgi:hypothetical protein